MMQMYMWSGGRGTPAIRKGWRFTQTGRCKHLCACDISAAVLFLPCKARMQLAAHGVNF